MKGKSEDKEHVMIRQTDWYVQAGRRPFREEGFTPELMQRIEAAAFRSNKGIDGFRWRKNVIYMGVSAAFLICILIWQSGGINSLQSLFPKGHVLQNAAALPSSEPTAAPQVYTPPMGSVEFEFSGKKYYMPLPADRNKGSAYAVETTQGILWSPAPHVINYTKPLYFHPTEPRILYLSSKDNPELSASSAAKVYSYPLFAGDENTYNYVSRICGAGNYAVVVSNTETVGTKISSKPIISVIDIRKVVPGGTVVPRELPTIDWLAAREYKSLIAIDKQHEELVILYSIADGKGGYGSKASIYDLETGQNHELTSQIEIQDNSITYKVAGEKRITEITMKLGHQWYWEAWNKQYGSR